MSGYLLCPNCDHGKSRDATRKESILMDLRRRCTSGEIIFSQGDPGDCAYIIEMGRVEVFVTSDSEKVVLSTLGVGDIFGEMSVLDGSSRSASVIALEPCELAIVSSEALSERFEAADPVVRLLIFMLLKHVRQSNRSQLKNANRSDGLISNIMEPETTSNQKEITLERLRLESDLKQALQHEEFQLDFQPIVEMKNGKLSGFEALIRWQSPSRGVVRPDIFIDIAEETSLIIPIGKWVIEQSCIKLALFQKEISCHKSLNSLFISINISSRQFYDPGFLHHLITVAKDIGLRPRNIKLEVTERSLMEGPTACHTIKKAREFGFQVALDDFGTGYSSLSYLSQFEIDNLKIDQSFVRKMSTDTKMFVITKAIASIASGLNLPSIAEGIETDKEYKALKNMGCEFGQGYFFSKPLPFDQAMRYLFENKIEFEKRTNSTA